MEQRGDVQVFLTRSVPLKIQEVEREKMKQGQLNFYAMLIACEITGA